MVTRKPTIPSVSTAQQASSTAGNDPPDNTAPPYPTTPTADTQAGSSVYSTDLNASPAFDLIDMNEARDRRRRDSDVSSHGTWASDDTNETLDDEDADKPEPLHVTTTRQDTQGQEGHRKQRDSGLPAALRPGPVNGAKVETKAPDNRQCDEESQGNPWTFESNNPYLQKTKQPPQQNGYGESSQKIWEQPLMAKPASPQPPPMPAQAPPAPPPAVTSQPPPAPVELPAEELSYMSLSGRKSPGTAASYETAEVLPVPQQGQSPLPPVTDVHTSESQAFPSSNPWSDDQGTPAPPPPAKEALSPIPSQPVYVPPPMPSSAAPALSTEPTYQPPPGPPPAPAGPLIDHEEPPQAQLPSVTNQPAALQSRDSIPETPGTTERRQRSEHYQIKHIRWFDSASGAGALRESPILTQNLNGPCPLLALVNALVLSTPPELDTPLVEALRTREQISLGLLLDAVFDELMSGRRGDTANALPDVAELYSFLLALHTGMNVNPRFITPATTPRGSFDGHPAALQGMHPAERSQHKPGCFEETKEMRLYSTFSIPLIHGWTAPTDTPAYAAFTRSAQSFEDAQNIQFAESELEDKLRTEGLSFQEQQTLEDIQTIRNFLQTWPTQLTDYGLETISTSLTPGQVAILFRNDHFSTLYKEPRHGALMTLVTDAGYSSHEEIVWESLVDVNGAASEMFSGDFRVVSHAEEARLDQGNTGSGTQDWQTVQRGNGSNQQVLPPQASSSHQTVEEVPPPLPGPRPGSQQPQDDLGANSVQRTASEQEDHDLALALQLQEEEEDQQRQAEERRRREQELSEQFLSNEEQAPAIPPRRSGGNARSPVSPQASNTNIPVTGGSNTGRRVSNRPNNRPAVNRPADSLDPDAPPTYEQSASDRPFRPAGATAPPTQGNPLTILDALTDQTSVNVAGRRRTDNRVVNRHSQVPGNESAAPPYPGRVQQAATVRDADDRCIMM